MFDLEMIEQMGSARDRELLAVVLGAQAGRGAALPPGLLPNNFLLFIDESTRQSRSWAMYRGDRSRKETLVDFGFRSPLRSTIDR